MSDPMTPKRRAALRDASMDAEALRKDWKDTLQHHQLRVGAQFDELRRRLRARPKGKQPKGLPSAKDAEHLRALVARVRIKTSKGRAKDLRRVEDVLRDALDRLPSE